ncbi:hypothetical protein C8R47DRAFT_1270522 [Mycena vitilis]|nr:hypothetical protein C8R47DRAFT_1270522 [Mycena vitilis]
MSSRGTTTWALKGVLACTLWLGWLECNTHVETFKVKPRRDKSVAKDDGRRPPKSIKSNKGSNFTSFTRGFFTAPIPLHVFSFTGITLEHVEIGFNTFRIPEDCSKAARAQRNRRRKALYLVETLSLPAASNRLGEDRQIARPAQDDQQVLIAACRGFVSLLNVNFEVLSEKPHSRCFCASRQGRCRKTAVQYVFAISNQMARLVGKPAHHDKVAPGMQNLAREVSTNCAKGSQSNQQLMSNRKREMRERRTPTSRRRSPLGRSSRSRGELAMDQRRKGSPSGSLIRRVRGSSRSISVFANLRRAQPREVSKALSRPGVTPNPAVPRALLVIHGTGSWAAGMDSRGPPRASPGWNRVLKPADG